VSARKRIVLIGALALAVSAVATVRADAQYIRRSRVVVVGGFYAPFWGYDPWWGSAWGPYPYPYPYPLYRDPGAAIRLEVKPKEAEVYVDGYYAGIVDNFDGVFQRLRVPPGDHQLTLYLDGYRTTTQKVYLTPDNTFKIKYTMERLSPGEQPEPRPQPPAPPAGTQPQYGPGAPPPNAPPYPPMRRGSPRAMPPNAPPPGVPPAPAPNAPTAPTGAEGYGTLAVRVQPTEVDVLIDGQVWHASDRNGVVIDVAEGRHTIEIRKPGYRTYITEVDVHRGETTPVNVSLRGQNDE
jgi:PEGA domain